MFLFWKFICYFGFRGNLKKGEGRVGVDFEWEGLIVTLVELRGFRLTFGLFRCFFF